MSHLQHLNEKYPVRRTEQEKAAFRAYLTDYVAGRGGNIDVKTTKDGKNKNVIIGNPLTADVIFTAHYDTPKRSLFPNLMLPRSKALFYLYQFLPITILLLASGLLGCLAFVLSGLVLSEPSRQAAGLTFMLAYYFLFYFMYFAVNNQNNYNDNTSGVATLMEIFDRSTQENLEHTAFIFFDNEEKGLKGSKGYAKEHKDALKERLIVNFDCVGNGEHILFIAKKGAETLPAYQALQETFLSKADGDYASAFYPMKGSIANSDYKSFECGVGCMACKKNKKGIFYAPYIHTAKDIVAKDENIAFLADTIAQYLA